MNDSKKEGSKTKSVCNGLLSAPETRAAAARSNNDHQKAEVV